MNEPMPNRKPDTPPDWDGEERRSMRLQGGISVADVVSIAASIITAIGIGGPLLVWGGKIDSRVQALEQTDVRIEVQTRERDEKSDRERDALEVELRAELRAMSDKLDRVLERIEVRR